MWKKDEHLYSIEELSTMSSRNPFALKYKKIQDPSADVKIIA